VSIGSFTTAIVHPREPGQPAILANAAAILISHNLLVMTQSPARKIHSAPLVLAGEALSAPTTMLHSTMPDSSGKGNMPI
jgi:hypothetical protein